MTDPRPLIPANAARLLDALGGGEHALISVDREVADHAVNGEVRFRHLGLRYFQVGRAGIAWEGSHHRHQEWTAQLNRFFQLPSLAAAYRETGDETYPRAARDYIADWVRAHPTRPDWTLARYDNTLNLSIRMLQWLLTLPDFLASPAFDDDFVASMLDSMRAQQEYLRTHLTEGGNWRIAQADSLLQTGIVLDMLPEAAGWRLTGVRALNDAFRRQVLPDGAHIERNPGYHHWMTNLFERYWRLGRAMPDLGLCIDTAGVARMHDYNLGTLYPNGSYNGLHDSNSRMDGAFDPKYFEAYHRFRREAGLPEELPTPTQVFPAAGQISLRSGWEADAVYLSFDATTWGGGHCHLSRNGVQLYAYGRPLLIDPGTLTYERSDPLLPHGKSTRAHNTLSLNGWNQSATDPIGTRHDAAPGYDLVQSTYTGGYWPGEFIWTFEQGHGHGLAGDHHRALLWVHGRFALVLDQLTRDFGPEIPSLESNWQLAAGPVTVDPDAMRAVTGFPDANLLLLFPLVAPGMTLSAHAGEMDPPRGWLQGQGGYVPATQLVLGVDRMAQAHATLATVLVPFRGLDAPPVTATAATGPRGVLTLTLTWGDGSRDEIAATPRLTSALETVGDLETDAALLHVHYDAAGRRTHGLAAHASYLSPIHPAPCDTLGMLTF